MDAREIPAAGSRFLTLPIDGAGTSHVMVLADRAGLSGSINGLSLDYSEGFLTAQLQNVSQPQLVLTNPTSDPVNAIVLVSKTDGSALAVELSSSVVPIGQQMFVIIREPPGGAAAPTAGLSGVVTAPDGGEADLSFFAYGSAAVAAFTPSKVGDYRIAVDHVGAALRLSFRTLSASYGMASLPGTFTETLVTGANGRADALNLDVDVAVTQSETFTLSGALAAADGTVVATAETAASLNAGRTTMRLSFRGPVLFAAAKDGPYHLIDLTLSRTNSLASGWMEAQLTTATQTTGAHRFNVFRPAVVIPEFVTVAEKDNGTQEVAFPVTLSEPLGVPVTVDYAAIEPAGFASWPEDFDPVWGRLTFLPGETTKAVTLTIKGDTLDEIDEGALVQFYASSGVTIGGYAQLGGVTIIDDDGPPVVVPGFAPATTEGDNGAQQVLVPVRLSAPSGKTVTVQYGPFTGDGWATPGDDFDVTAGTLTFQPGETAKTITLIVKSDILDEPDEGALISFSQATNSTVGGYGVGGVTILDDD